MLQSGVYLELEDTGPRRQSDLHMTPYDVLDRDLVLKHSLDHVCAIVGQGAVFVQFGEHI
jgi:hypothetical protein